jgi:hypothetical protein
VVRALAKGWFSVFEVLGVEIDEAIEVRDIFRRRRLRVRERLATRQLERGDLLVTWVSQWPEHAEFEGALVRFPRADAPRAQAFLNTVMDTLRKRRGLTWRQRHEELAPLAIAAIAKLNSELPQIKLTNFDGDALILSEAEYRVREPQVARALARAEELEDAGDGAFLWRDAEQNVIRARIEIEGDTLRAATNSRQRLEQTRRLLEDTLGDRIEHRADTFTEPNPILRADGMQPAPKLDGKPLPPEVCAALAEVLRERLTRWLDEPIPALGDKTPRQAVRSQRGRQDVATLLLKQEQIFARGSGPELTEALDFPALWAALGLDYPPPVAD